MLKKLLFSVFLLTTVFPAYSQTAKSASTQRNELADRLRDKTGFSKEAYSAFSTVPREQFIPQLVQDLAYLDTEIPVTGSSFLPSPSSIARIVAQSTVRPNDRVLIYGPGIGYTAAIFGRIASEVFGIELNQNLASGYIETLSALKYSNTAVKYSKNVNDFKGSGPFSLIVVQGAVLKLPEEILSQVKSGGRCVFALADLSGFQILAMYEKPLRGCTNP